VRSKSENTTHFIITTAASVFNRKGYAGTSLSDLTKATGLTKGAFYGNFKNKEDLAVQAFKQNVKRVILPLSQKLTVCSKIIDKLFTITDYYRHYYDNARQIGGCPLLNVSVDTRHTNPALFKAAKAISKKLETQLKEIIQTGVKNNELKKNIDPDKYAKNIYAMIEGAVFMSFTQGDKDYLTHMMNHVNDVILNEMKR